MRSRHTVRDAASTTNDCPGRNAVSAIRSEPAERDAIDLEVLQQAADHGGTDHLPLSAEGDQPPLPAVPCGY